MRSGNLRRRRFLQIAASTAAAGAVSCSKKAASPWRVFSEDEAFTLDAIAERIVPSDANPGASDAGAVTFIDRQLGGVFRKYVKTYRQGLVGVDHVSNSRFGKRFAELEPEQRDEVLATMESGRVNAADWNPTLAKAFFELVRDHVMQSYYGDPRHGGNREYASWLMLGVPPAPIRGRRIYDLNTNTPDEDRRNKPWR